ncbi:MAG: ribulose-phosphate 3-epimerase [Metamycoplasmataceae bacterium]
MNKNDRNISPSILDIPSEEKINFVNKYLKFNLKFIHYDFMDNIFVPNKGIEIEEFKNIIKNTPRHVSNAHLMVVNPFEYANQLKEFATCLTVHYEAISREEVINFAKEFCIDNWVGLAISPKTTFEEIEDIIQFFDIILIMGVNPGFGGQAFIEDTYNKVKTINEYIIEKKLPALIEVDGGVNEKVSSKLWKYGANILVCGSHLYKNPTLETIKKLVA